MTTRPMRSQELSKPQLQARNHPRGDGVRGPIICFALGLALTLLGVSGGAAGVVGSVGPDSVGLPSSAAGAQETCGSALPSSIQKTIELEGDLNVSDSPKDLSSRGFSLFRLEIQSRDVIPADGSTPESVQTRCALATFEAVLCETLDRRESLKIELRSGGA